MYECERIADIHMKRIDLNRILLKYYGKGLRTTDREGKVFSEVFLMEF